MQVIFYKIWIQGKNVPLGTITILCIDLGTDMVCDRVVVGGQFVGKPLFLTNIFHFWYHS